MTAFQLPLFPLDLVLFPGMSVPLHLFEPRYRQLLADVRDGDGRFGIMCAIAGVAERDLPKGRVGCVAAITQVSILPDGRADIVVVGRERFAFETLVESDTPYHIALVASLEDEHDVAPVMLIVSADDVATRFTRVFNAVRTIHDDVRPMPALPDDPAQLAYVIAAMIDLDLEEQQALLSERSPAARLTRIDAVLRRVLPDLEIQSALRQGRAD